MTRTLLALTLVLGTLCPALASAQDPARVETFDDADLVTGTLQSPMVDVIASRRLGRRHTLISPRAHYTPEMLRSVENL
jgi:hypothetical protein